MKTDVSEDLGETEESNGDFTFDALEFDDDLWEEAEIDFDDSPFNVDYGDDGEYEDVDELDSTFQTQDEKSDDAYQRTTDKIVEISKTQLENQYNSKIELQKSLSKFFSRFISFQFVALIVFMALKGFIKNFELSDAVILSFMTSVFVETLGAIIIMIKFAFNSKQETEILEILNSVISNFKIYNSSEHGKKKEK